jgi:hypothetical protein
MGSLSMTHIQPIDAFEATVYQILNNAYEIHLCGLVYGSVANQHKWRQSSAILSASTTHLDHYAQPGQEKRSLRLSAEALSRSSEQIGRMVELQNDHRAMKTR